MIIRLFISAIAFFISMFTYCQNPPINTPLEGTSYSIISLGVINPNTNIQGGGAFFQIVGSGVFFYVLKRTKKDTVMVPCIITAKHVIHNPENGFKPSKINIRYKKHEKLSLFENHGITIPLRSSSGQKLWYELQDSSIDLACIPLINNKDLGSDTIDLMPYSFMRNISDCYASQEIYAVGFPAMNDARYSTMPLIRRGIISWISPIQTNTTPFLIDCNLFPGNSGGPIFVSNTGFTKDGFYKMDAGVSFIGIATTMTNKRNPIINRSNAPISDSIKNYLKDMYTVESYSLGTIIPSARVVELLKYVEKKINE